MSCRFSVTAHLWRILFLLLLTTIVFYTFRDPYDRDGMTLLNESSAAATPQCRPSQPTIYIVKSIHGQNVPFLLGTFYLIGLKIGADFYISDDMQNNDWQLASNTKSSVVFCLTQCSSVIAKLQQYTQNVITITAIRDPVQLFRQQFATLDVQAFNRASNDLVRFMSDPVLFYRNDEADAAYARNFLSSSLEIEANGDYMSFVDSLRMLDSMMGVVIVCEYMIESMVLLEAELGLECIDWEGLLYLYQSNEYEPSANTPLNSQIKNWNELDWELYQHFNTTLTRKIKQFGAERLVEKVAQYELRLDEMSSQCQEGAALPFCEYQINDADVLRFIRNTKN